MAGNVLMDGGDGKPDTVKVASCAMPDQSKAKFHLTCEHPSGKAPEPPASPLWHNNNEDKICANNPSSNVRYWSFAPIPEPTVTNKTISDCKSACASDPECGGYLMPTPDTEVPSTCLMYGIDGLNYPETIDASSYCEKGDGHAFQSEVKDQSIFIVKADGSSSTLPAGHCKLNSDCPGSYCMIQGPGPYVCHGAS